MHFRQPEHSRRPTFPQLVELLSQADFELFVWEEEYLRNSDPRVKEIGAPLEIATGLYPELQKTYLGKEWINCFTPTHTWIQLFMSQCHDDYYYDINCTLNQKLDSYNSCPACQNGHFPTHIWQRIGWNLCKWMTMLKVSKLLSYSIYMYRFLRVKFTCTSLSGWSWILQ